MVWKKKTDSTIRKYENYYKTDLRENIHKNTQKISQSCMLSQKRKKNHQ